MPVEEIVIEVEEVNPRLVRAEAVELRSFKLLATFSQVEEAKVADSVMPN